MLLKQLLLCPLIYQVLLFVNVNGSPEIASDSNYVVKNPYPFSAAQLMNKFDQQEMDKRIASAKQWNAKLEQIFYKYKSNLKSFFTAHGLLKSRGEILRDAFNEAIKNKNIGDLVVLLVTTIAEEKETFKMLGYCEEMKKMFEKNLLLKMFERDIKKILFALCSNQRETTFDSQREQGEIEKDRETLSRLTAYGFKYHELIPMFTTKSYAYLRELFANDKYKSRSAIKKEAFRYEVNFYFVVHWILRDAVDGRPEFLSFILYKALEVLNYKRKSIFKKMTKKPFHDYADAHRVFQRILATRAQIDLADIVRVKKNNRKSLGSFGRVIGTLKAIQGSTKGEEKKLFEAYIEILEFVRESAKIDISEERTIEFDSGRGNSGKEDSKVSHGM